MSRETTGARAAAASAERAWAAHLHICAGCRTATRARKWADLCGTGFRARDDIRLARANVAEQVRLDSLPIPGQGRLL